jgi:hypothetical protein
MTVCDAGFPRFSLSARLERPRSNVQMVIATISTKRRRCSCDDVVRSAVHTLGLAAGEGGAPGVTALSGYSCRAEFQ